MFFIHKPNFTIKDTFPVCVEFVSDPAIKVYLESLQNVVESSSLHYEKLASSGRLNEFKLPRVFDEKINPQNKWLINLYKYYFSAKTKPQYGKAYKFYNGIKNYESYQMIRRCTYCNHSMVEALDHFLPESVFNALAVNPINLIPSCDFCNETKWKYTPSNLQPNSVLIHPYFDNIKDIDWLKVRVKTVHLFKVNPDIVNCFKNINFIYFGVFSTINIVDLTICKYSKKMIHTIFYVNHEIRESNELLFDRINLTFDKVGLQTTFSFAANDFFQIDLMPNLQYGEYLNKNDADLRKLFGSKSKTLSKQGYNRNHWKIAIYNFLSQYKCSFKNFC